MMLKVEQLVSGYGSDPILRGVTFEVSDSSITAVFGHNGAGKSSLVRALIGLIPVWEGRIVLDGHELSGLSSRSRVEAGIAVSFQDDSVFPTMSVENNLRLGGHVRQRDKLWLNERLVHVLGLFPKLEGRLRQPAYTLSGGERRMLSIGMALMTDPKLMILDEPSTGLSPGMTEFVFQCVRDVRDKLGKSIILIEQNVQQALTVADKAVVLKTGTIIFDGSADELANDESELVMFF
jgi:branched-chain amino acid transport system ATP-binding protein